jgi:peptide/nickel transport system substrate-binding protein
VLTSCAKPPVDSGAPPGDEEPATNERDTLIYATDRDTDTFDLFYATFGTVAFYNIYEGLLSFDHEGNIMPGLAERWEVSDEGLEITLYIKQGVKFHDGTPFNADAVKKHFDRLLDPEIASPTAADFQWISSTEARDEHTVVFHLDEPYGNATTTLAWGGAFGSVQSPTAWEQYGPEGTGEYGSLMAVGTGPFMLEEWVPGDRYILVRNDDYTHGPPWFDNPGPAYLKRVEVRIIPEAATRLAELEAGNIDILENVPPEHVERVKSMPGVTLIQEPAWGLGYLGMATDKAPFNDVRVRKAINLAIDREDIVSSVFFGLVTPAYGYLPPSHGLNMVEDRDIHRYDPAAAKALLAEAGHPNGFTAVLATENRTEHVRVAEVLQDMLANVGITVEIVQYDRAGYADYLRAGKQELFMRQYTWHGLEILPWFLAGWHFPYPGHSRWQDAQTDALFEGAEATPTVEVRAEKYKEVQRHLMEQAVWAPLWYPNQIQAVRDEVLGWKFHRYYNLFNMLDLKVLDR